MRTSHYDFDTLAEKFLFLIITEFLRFQANNNLYQIPQVSILGGKIIKSTMICDR